MFEKRKEIVYNRTYEITYKGVLVEMSLLEQWRATAYSQEMDKTQLQKFWTTYFQIERGILQAVAVGSVMAGSILNAGIRLILPTLADRAGRITCIQGVLFVAMIAMLFLISGNNRLITMAIILAYGCFGGIMGSFPSLSSEVFGLRYAGQNYGIIMSGIIIVTITSPVISNMILIHELSEVVRFMTGFCFAVIALGFSMLLKKEINQSGKEVKNYGTC